MKLISRPYYRWNFRHVIMSYNDNDSDDDGFRQPKYSCQDEDACNYNNATDSDDSSNYEEAY